jgi:hypothetical protein
MHRGNESVQSWGASLLMAGSFLGLVIVPALLSISLAFFSFHRGVHLLPTPAVPAAWMLAGSSLWAAVMLATAYVLQLIGGWMFTSPPEQRMGVAPWTRIIARLGLTFAAVLTTLQAVLFLFLSRTDILGPPDFTGMVIVARAAYAGARITLALYCRREVRRWPGGEAWKLPTICVAVVLVREVVELLTLITGVLILPELISVIGFVAVLVDLTAWFELLRQMRDRWSAPDETTDQPVTNIMP